MLLCALVAASLSVALPVPRAKRRHRGAVAPASRTARSERIAIMALRSEMLHDFLVRAGTEAPIFYDARVVAGNGGIRIGPTSVDVDFLGAPIVRAHVRNVSDQNRDVLVSVRIRDARGRSVEASTWVERLEPGASRSIEVFCPAPLVPASVEWKVDPL